MAKFLLNQQEQAVDLSMVDVNTTALHFLRNQGLIGTKEGCASGDCGACTAVVIELADSEHSLLFKSVNTCMTLVHNLAGKCLVTIEGIAKPNQLHPIQQAMINCSGSQCGYCTPGFVMAMYVWFTNYQANDEVNQEEIEKVLSGNLCRCTGYQPIIESCYQAIKQKANYQDNYNNQQMITRLKELQKSIADESSSGSTMSTFFSPTSLAQCSQYIADYSKAKIIAGGTDLLLQNKQLEQVISLQNVPELSMISDEVEALHIGASVTLNQALPLIIKYFPHSQAYLHRFASTQIRNYATLCGNIATASPIGDLAPFFIALNARLLLRKEQQTREMAIKDFFIAYRQTALQNKEWIQGIIIPKLQANQHFYTHKLSKRFTDDISIVGMAMMITSQENNNHDFVVVFAGMEEIPKQANKLMRMLISQCKGVNIRELDYQYINKLSTDILESIKEEFTPLSDVRAQAEYRLNMASSLVQRALLQHSNQLTDSEL